MHQRNDQQISQIGLCRPLLVFQKPTTQNQTLLCQPVSFFIPHLSVKLGRLPHLKPLFPMTKLLIVLAGLPCECAKAIQCWITGQGRAASLKSCTPMEGISSVGRALSSCCLPGQVSTSWLSPLLSWNCFLSLVQGLCTHFPCCVSHLRTHHKLCRFP